MAMLFQSNIGPIVFMCVYMPSDYGDSESAECYADVCAKIASLYAECDAVHAVIAGDFNCNVNTRFYDQLSHLISSNNLIPSDINRLCQSETFTLCNDGGSATSWIGHYL